MYCKSLHCSREKERERDEIYSQYFLIDNSIRLLKEEKDPKHFQVTVGY